MINDAKRPHAQGWSFVSCECILLHICPRAQGAQGPHKCGPRARTRIKEYWTTPMCIPISVYIYIYISVLYLYLIISLSISLFTCTYMYAYIHTYIYVYRISKDISAPKTPQAIPPQVSSCLLIKPHTWRFLGLSKYSHIPERWLQLSTAALPSLSPPVTT